jgi:hypothetical protein
LIIISCLVVILVVHYELLGVFVWKVGFQEAEKAEVDGSVIPRAMEYSGFLLLER